MTVVVGVDGSAQSHPAIQLAKQEADFRKADLVAVLAYGGESTLGAPAARPVATTWGLDEQEESARVTLRETIAAALGDEAAEGVGLRPVLGVAAYVLVQAAGVLDADLMVVASRRQHTPSRLLGAVSQYVIRHAPCPVLVVQAADPPLLS